MKKFELIIIVETDDKMTREDFKLFESDVIDGYELTRNDRLGDVTTDFFINKMYIDKITEQETDPKKLLIGKIKDIIDKWGATTSCELQLDHSPCLKSIGNRSKNISELVESFNMSGVGTVVYHDEIELDENNYTYEELPIDILGEIADIMDDYDTDMEKTIKRSQS